jgi:PAS domain S-box-containing protein
MDEGHHSRDRQDSESRLQRRYTELEQLIAELRRAIQEIRAGGLAALNILEDALMSGDALRESEERLRITMEAATDYAIITMDQFGNIEGWSAGAERMFGYTEAEAKHASGAIIFTEADQAAGVFEQEIERAVSEGRAPDERWHRRKDGSRFFLSGITRPIYNPGLSGFVKVAQDLTEKQQASEAMRISEERYRVALQSADMAAWDWDVVNNKIRWSDQHFMLLGLEPEDRVVDSEFFLRFVHPSDRQAVIDRLREAMELSGIYRMESFRVVRADGAERWMNGYGRTLSWSEGKATRMVGVMYDVTDRVEVIHSLREKQVRLDIAQRAARVGIWSYDLAEQRGIASPEWVELTGYPDAEEQFDMPSFLALVHPDDREKIAAAQRTAVSGRGVVEVEFRIMHAQRGMLWLLMRGQLVAEEGGGGATLMGSLIDITERKALEQQKDEFIGIASHELRTPVTSIKAYTEILTEMLEDRGEDQLSGLMNKLAVQVDRLSDLIYALLDTTRISEGKLQLQKIRFPIDDLIRETAETMQRLAEHQHIELRLSAGCEVTADRERLRQVLVNLISNAIKYAPGTERIVVDSSLENDAVAVYVQDFGIGISPTVKDMVFDRFYRSNEAGSIAGLGLGLFITAGIIHNHGGTIWVESEPGNGATFCFRLPREA